MLQECWTKVYIVCTCHATSFTQHGSTLTLSFNVKSKMTMDMLLPVILSELVDSEDEKYHRGKTREWTSFFNLYFFLCCLCMLSLVCLPSLFPLSLTSSAASLYSSSCSGNLERWSESSLLLLKVISIWYVQVYDMYRCMVCYYFAERFSFVESFEISSFNIRNDVTKIKCWMKQGVNQSNMKILLDEPENVAWKVCSQSNMIFSFFLAIFLLLLNRSNI